MKLLIIFLLLIAYLAIHCFDRIREFIRKINITY
jgi:hypothetical protein